MKAKDRILTPHGEGMIVGPEGSEGVLAKRFLVRLNDVPHNFKDMHDKQCGMYYHEIELKKIK